MSDKIDEILNSWHNTDPSVVRSRRNHESIEVIANDVMSLKITLTTTNRDLIRAEERLEYLSRKVEKLESVLNGTNSLAMRVHLLEKQDVDFDEILKEMESLNTLLSIIKNFPLGLKGMLLSIVATVIIIAFVSDTVVRVYGYDYIKNYMIEETK
jgi:tRNA U34 5-carboxymethylaminomethyl modifying GTPase MnmE/TrmE